jgi:MFS family permease
VRQRPPARSRAERTHLLQESGEGFRLVFGQETLRSIAILVFVLTGFAVVPEGLAAAWAAQGDPDAAARGLNQGLIMAAGPIGFVIGGILTSRLATETQRERLIRPLAVLSALILVPAMAAPPPTVVAILVGLAGIAQGGLMPTLNGRFVLILPHGYRARAFGVMQTGMQLSQFAAVIATGVLADHFRLPLVVGLWSIGGAIAMALLAARWPSPATFAAATDAAEASIAAAPAPPAPRPAPGRHRAENRQQVATTSVTPERP